MSGHLTTSEKHQIGVALAALHVGDTVMRTWGREGLKLFEVARVTPLHIALKGSHQKWRTSDGGMVSGGTGSADRIRAFDEGVWLEYVRHVAHLAHLSDLSQFDWGKLDPETARKMHALLPSV